MKKYISSIGDIRHFNENISVLLTSTVFIILTASLPRTTIMEIFSWPIISFVLMMIFVVRPLSIWVSTIGTELTRSERALVRCDCAARYCRIDGFKLTLRPSYVQEGYEGSFYINSNLHLHS